MITAKSRVALFVANREQVLLFAWTARVSHAKDAHEQPKQPGKWLLKDLASVQHLVFSLTSALMEGQTDGRVARRLVFHFTEDVFKEAKRFILTELKRLQRTGGAYSQRVMLAIPQYAHLLEGICELCGVYLELATLNTRLRANVEQVLKEVGHWPESGLRKISQIEYTWAGNRVCKLYFPTPAVAQALSLESSLKMREQLDISSPEQRKRGFLVLAHELLDEMKVLYELDLVPGCVCIAVQHEILTQHLVSVRRSNGCSRYNKQVHVLEKQYHQSTNVNVRHDAWR